MVCFNPIIAWQKTNSSLTDTPQKYYKDKKLKFKEPTGKAKENYRQVKIACGKCLGCKLDHSNMWATRIMLEAKKHDNNCFITLTYDNENVPKTPSGHITLRKKDFQDFIKRLRYHCNTKISYFGCGEYGPTTHRSHGHFVILGWKPDDSQAVNVSKTKNQMYTSKKLQKIWGKGYITNEELNYKTACYTARYCQKKAGMIPTHRENIGFETTTKIDERNGQEFTATINHYKTQKYDKWGREKEFIMMSKKPALGKDYWEKNKEKILKNNGILLKIGNKVQLKNIPRYFKKLWEKSDMSEFDTYRYKNNLKCQEILQDNLKKISAPDHDKEKIYYETLKNALTTKASYLKRNQN